MNCCVCYRGSHCWNVGRWINTDVFSWQKCYERLPTTSNGVHTITSVNRLFLDSKSNNPFIIAGLFDLVVRIFIGEMLSEFSSGLETTCGRDYLVDRFLTTSSWFYHRVGKAYSVGRRADIEKPYVTCVSTFFRSKWNDIHGWVLKKSAQKLWPSVFELNQETTSGKEKCMRRCGCPKSHLHQLTSAIGEVLPVLRSEKCEWCRYVRMRVSI